MTAPSAPARPRRSQGWHLATIGGVPVLLARSWVIIAIAITVLFGPQVLSLDPGAGAFGAYAVALLYAVLLLLSVLVHELAHAATASIFSMAPTRIVLTLWGGHTTFDRDAPGPLASFLVSAAGPLSNVALAAALYWGLGTATLPAVGQLLLFAVVVSNAFVGIMNALPGLPLDGGRMLEALVWGVGGDRDRATVVAAVVGRVVAIAVPVGAAVFLLRDGSLRGDLFALAWSALVGALLWTSAGAELAWARGRRRAAALHVRSLVTAALVVPAATPLSALADRVGLGAAGDADRPVVLVDEVGAPVGVLDTHAAASVPEERRALVPASAAAHAVAPGALVGLSLSGRELFDLLPALPVEPWVVVAGTPASPTSPTRPAEPTGAEVVGVLLSRDVAAAMSGRRARARVGERSQVRADRDVERT